MTFLDLGIDQDIADALAEHGITEPFPIQQEAIPLALAGNDLIGQAKTGTGKTLGFGLPLLQKIGPDPAPGVVALIVVPTRELAAQVTEDLITAAEHRNVIIAPIYGGKAYEGQIAQLKSGAQIVVGTPGRLLDLAQQRVLNLHNVHTMILDEADKMLDLGFLPDVERLFNQVNAVRQTMLFSATMPGAVVALARRFMNRPIHIRISDPDEGLTKESIKQLIYRTHSLDKDEVIARILQAEGRGKTVIFTRTKRAASRLAEELSDRGFNATAVHGDINQEARERHLAAFRSGKFDVLVATDVAARGIDVHDVTHVINHTIPDDEKEYLHRIGRTGRAGKTGTAITFVDWEDMARWGMINKALEFGLPEPPETYSTSPHLYTDLDIPEGTKGRLVPKPARPREERTGGRGQDSRSRDGRGGRGRSSGEGRSRQRSRGGKGHGGSSADAASTSAGASEGAAQGSGSGQQGEGGAPKRRRRRRRGGSGGGQASGSSVAPHPDASSGE